MYYWLTIILAGLLTFGLRLSFIALFGRIEPHPLIRRGLRFVPPAVLLALIMPDLLSQNGQLALSLDNSRLLAGLIAMLIAWRTQNAIWTVLGGMIALFILS